MKRFPLLIVVHCVLTTAAYGQENSAQEEYVQEDYAQEPVQAEPSPDSAFSQEPPTQSLSPLAESAAVAGGSGADFGYMDSQPNPFEALAEEKNPFEDLAAKPTEQVAPSNPWKVDPNDPNYNDPFALPPSIENAAIEGRGGAVGAWSDNAGADAFKPWPITDPMAKLAMGQATATSKEFDALATEQAKWEATPGYKDAVAQQNKLDQEIKAYNDILGAKSALQKAKAANPDDVVLGNAMNRGTPLTTSERATLRSMGTRDTGIHQYDRIVSFPEMQEKSKTLSGAIHFVDSVYSFGTLAADPKSIPGYVIEQGTPMDEKTGETFDNVATARGAAETTKEVLKSGATGMFGAVLAVPSAAMGNMKKNLGESQEKAAAFQRSQQELAKNVRVGGPETWLPGAPLTLAGTPAGQAYLATKEDKYYYAEKEHAYRQLEVLELAARAKQWEALERQNPTKPTERNYVEEFKARQRAKGN